MHCLHQLKQGFLSLILGAALALTPAHAVDSLQEIPARNVGAGPYKRLVIRNVNIIDGTGAPMQGPYDVVIERDKIAEIRSIGAPGAVIPARRADAGEHEEAHAH